MPIIVDDWGFKTLKNLFPPNLVRPIEDIFRAKPPILVLSGDPEVEERGLILEMGLDTSSIIVVDHFNDERKLKAYAETYWRLLSDGARKVVVERIYTGPIPRRLLLRGRVIERVSIPYIEPELCIAGRGCRLCVNSCPSNAIVVGEGAAKVTSSCTLCGLCLGECPVGALKHGIYGEEAIFRLVKEISNHYDSAALLFLSLEDYRRLRREYREFAGRPWLVPIKLLSVNQLTLTHLLYAASMGFTVAVVDNSGGRVARRVRAAARILEAVGTGDVQLINLEEIESLTLNQGKRLLMDVPKPGLEGLRELLRLLDASKISDLVEVPSIGFVSPSENPCILCGACVEKCPTDALFIEKTGGMIKLLFKHSACISCGICVNICPENALDLREALSPQLFVSGQGKVIFMDEEARCRKCGGPLGASKAMISRIESKFIERGFPERLASRVWLCNRCKRVA